MTSHNYHSLDADPPVHQNTNNNGNIQDKSAPVINTSHTTSNLNGQYLNVDPLIYQDANE